MGDLLQQDYILLKSTFTALAADAMITWVDPITGRAQVNIDLFKLMPDWKAISVEFDVTTLTGTSVTFKGFTSNYEDTPLTSSSVAAKKGDGSTAMDSASITATGKYMASMSREGASSAVSNIGAVLGFNADVSTVTVLTGTAKVLITR